MKYKNIIKIIFTLCYLVCKLKFGYSEEDNYGKFYLDQDWCDCSLSCSKADKLCGGYYQDESLLQEPSKKSSDNKLIIKSDHSNFISKGISNFSGNVIVTNKYQKLFADKLLVKQNLNSKLESLQVEGKVKLIEPGLRIIGEDLLATLREPEHKKISNANYRFYPKHATGDSTAVEIFSDQKLHMYHATYTTCSPKQQTWKLAANKIILDKTIGRGQAFQAKFYLNQQPIFYLPYISFPIDKNRHTGFMLPSVDDSSKHGFTLNVPWYWNIASNYDYMITPIFMAKRGMKLNNEFRYLTSHSLGRIKYDFIFKDKHYLNLIKKHKSNDGNNKSVGYKHLKNNDWRYGFWYKNITKITDNWDLYINYNKVTDSYYMKDFGQNLGKIGFFNLSKVVKDNEPKFIPDYIGGVTTMEELLHENSLHLPQAIKLVYINPYGVLNLNFSQYQTLYPIGETSVEEQFKKFPELNWQANKIQLADSCHFKYKFNYTNFKLRQIDDIVNTTAKRVHFRPSLEYSTFNRYIQVKPRLQLDILNYHDITSLPKHHSRVIPIVDVNSSMYFARNVNNNLQQTLEPHLYYLYVPKVYQKQYPNFDSKFIEYNYRQLFLDNRYTGFDRISDANQLTLGMKTSVRAIDGIEKISFAVARARYFKKPTPQLQENLNFNHWSPITMLFVYNFNRKLSLEADLILEKIHKIRNASLSSQYKFTPEKIINVGYQYAKFNAIANHQIQVSSFFAIKQNMNLLGKVDYDLSKKRLSYALLGLDLDSCCIGLRLAISRSYLTNRTAEQIKYNNKFLAQIIFKGFTALGSLEDNCFSDKAPKSRF